MSLNKFDFVFAGNYLTTLVGALELAKAGKKICIVNPVKTWGGHFARLNINGIDFDPGAVSHEFTSFNNDNLKDPLEYTPVIRNDWGRFTGLIEEYTRSHIELAKMDTPLTVYDGKLYPDIIMANKLDVLQHPVIAGRIKSEIENHPLSPDNPKHARNKKSSAVFLQSSYYDISLANHGSTLHSSLFEPYFYKMSCTSSTRLLARYHRIGWLPVYYPETILSQYGNKPQQLPETYFCYPKAGHIGILGETLVNKLQQAGVTIYREPVEKLETKNGTSSLLLTNGVKLEAPKIIWSLTHDQLVSTATGSSPNKFERWSATLVFLSVPREKMIKTFSVLFSPDDRTIFYRACNQTHSAGLDEDLIRIVVELNPDFLQSSGLNSDELICDRLKTDFVSLGFVSSADAVNIAGIKTLKNVLLLPSKENWQLLEQERDILYENYPGVDFTRNTEAFFTDTLNDQIMKGLKIAALYK